MPLFSLFSSSSRGERTTRAQPTSSSSHRTIREQPSSASTSGTRKLTKARPLSSSNEDKFVEKEYNFRKEADRFGVKAPDILKERVPKVIQEEVDVIGQFAMVASGHFDPDIIFKYIKLLVRIAEVIDQPHKIHKDLVQVKEYSALSKAKIVEVFHGATANLQGYAAYRAERKQAIVAFSGTTTGEHALHDILAIPVSTGTTAKNTKQKALRKCLEDHPDVKEIVITGHSLGAAQSYLFAIELLRIVLKETPDAYDVNLPHHIMIKVITFGCPRVGDEALVSSYRDLVEKYGKHRFIDYSIRNYNDGVPCLPYYNPLADKKTHHGTPVDEKKWLSETNYYSRHFPGRFRHFCQEPFYEYRGSLYRIPNKFKEYTRFEVDPNITNPTSNYPGGGHNYYNDCNLERFYRFSEEFMRPKNQASEKIGRAAQIARLSS